MFWNSQIGFVATSTGDPDLFRTTSGRLMLTDWSAMTIDPAWFGPQFSALPDAHVRIAGSRYCASVDYAATWNCRDSIDPLSDYVTFFIEDQYGWVGGGGDQGELVGQPPNFRGYVYLTTSHVFERDFDHIRVAEFDGDGTP